MGEEPVIISDNHLMTVIDENPLQISVPVTGHSMLIIVANCHEPDWMKRCQQ